MNSENINKQPSNSDEISLNGIVLEIIEWYKFLLSKWGVLLLFCVIGALVGFGYAHYKKAVYTAVTTFVLEDGDSGGGLGKYAGLASMVGVDVGGGGSGGIFRGDNILELYKSRTMIQKTLLTEVEYDGKKQLLVDRYIAFNGLREKWAKFPALKDIQFNVKHNFTRLQDSVLGAIVNDINKNYLKVVKPDKLLSIIKAEVRGGDEFFAKEFNDHIVQNVNDFYIQTKTKRSLDNIAILQQKTDSVRAVMNGAIYSAAAAMDATPNLNPTRQVQRVVPAQRSQFSAETNKDILGELVKNLEMSKMAMRKEYPLIQVVDSPVFPLEKEEFGKMKGMFIGGVLFTLMTALFLLFKRFLINH
ncbi:lipopolysaccharide biosynthesis protein [Pedobacter nyackensis]|uniref:lipopolysaccharide biosynthesis protein n=1 Tax=Pedobacter nyackensis TaxID=475255 RepID=UPI00292EB8B8|nr:lipopolysaccharide biosynthesis protein [Pedobacter nyackensis]